MVQFPFEIQQGKTLQYKSATKKTIWPEALGKNWWINLSYVWDHVWGPPIPRAGDCDPFASRPALLATSVQDTARGSSLKLLGVFLMDSTHTHKHTHMHAHTDATHFSLAHSMLEIIFNNFLSLLMMRNTPMAFVVLSSLPCIHLYLYSSLLSL